MIDKTKTPILISMPRCGSHWVGSYIREAFKSHGVILPGTSELMAHYEDNDRPLPERIEYFEYTRNHLNADIFSIYHGDHLWNDISILSRPKYSTMFDWFKEYYDGYQIVLLRRKNIYRQYLSFLFHQTIRRAYVKSTTERVNWNAIQPWHNIVGTQNVEIVKSAIEMVGAKFVHNPKWFESFVHQVRYFEEDIVTYYTKGKYSIHNVRNLWLEDLNDELLTEWFVPDDRKKTFVMEEKILPFPIKYETYFSKDELDKMKSKCNQVFENELKHYGYSVD